MAEIFDERIFGRRSEFSDIASGKRKVPDEEPDWGEGCVNINITIFDYILAQMLNLVPFSDKRVFYDWTGFNTTSTVTSRKVYNTFEHSSLSDLVHNTLVHEDLFYDAVLDISSFFVGLFFPSEPYKVCCLQWESYIEIYWYIYDTIHKENFDCERTTTPGQMIHVYCSPNIHTGLDILDDQDLYSILCSQSWDAIRMSRANKNTTSIYAYYILTSELGNLDVYFGQAKGPYINDHDIWTAFDIGSITPAAFPALRVGESFFSDIYGLQW